MNGLKTDTIINRDALYALRELPEESVHCCVTSPPYYALRDYGLDAQIGREDTPEQYIDRLTEVFRELRRVLRSDGTFWLNIADTYCGTGNKGYHADPKNPKGRNGQQIARNNRVSGCKQKDLIGIPWLLAFALRADGWYLRSDIIWAKKNCMPESVKDRPTKSHEYIFLLSKSQSYYYDNEAIKEPSVTGKWDAMPPIGGVKHTESGENPTYSGNTPSNNGMRNKRDVWFVSTKPYKGAHYATFPPDLITPCILAGAPETCCAECGAPYARVAKIVGKQVTESMRIAGCNDAGEYNGQATKDFESAKAQNASDTKRRILESMSQVKDYSFEPTCTCNAGTTSGIVFDPFVGSGTTVATAIQLGRRGVGLDLSFKYLNENAKARIDDVRLPLLEDAWK
mgnify:CR=1 FL=1